MPPLRRPPSHAHSTRGRRHLLLGAGGMAATLALLLPSRAMADDYIVNSEAELTAAINNANANSDPSARIILGSSFTVSSTALPGAVKPITIDTAGFTLSGSGSSIAFTGSGFTTGTLTLNGTMLGNATGTAGSALSLNTGGNVISNATVTGGSQSTANVAGTNGVALGASQSFTNNGTITGGSAQAYTGGAADAGAGVTLSSSGSLTNTASGTIQGGGSAGAGAGAGVYVNSASNVASITNAGTIQGGSDSSGGNATGGAAISGTGGFTTTINNSGTLTGGSGAAAIAASGSGQWVATVVNSGTIQAGSGSTTAIQFGTTTNSTATLELQAGSTIVGNVIAGSSNDVLRLGGDTDASFDVSSIGASGQYRGFDNYQKSGASTWTLTGDSTAGLGWTISQGTLKTGNGTINFDVIYDNANLEFGGSGSVSASLITGSGSVVQSGSGTTTFASTNFDYTGGTTITGGTLSVFSDVSLGTAASTLTLNGGTLLYTGGTSNTSGRTIMLGDRGGTFNISSTTYTIGNALTGLGSLTKAGAGYVALTADNSYTGGTTISAGSLLVGNGGTSGSIVGDVLDNGALVFNRTSDLTYAGAISGTGLVSKTGSNTLTLTGNSSYTGATSLTGGTLLLSGGQITATSGITMTGTGAALTVDGSLSNLVTTGATTLSSNGTALTVQNSGTAMLGTLTLSGTLNIANALTVTGAGSSLTNTTLTGGAFGTATINVLDGANMASSGAVTLGNGTLPTQPTNMRSLVTISGAGSQWTINDALAMRRGTLTISGGGVLSASSALFGYASGTSTSNPSVDLVVTGTGSRLVTTGTLALTNTTSNTNGPTLTIANGGAVETGSGTLDMSAGVGALNIGAASGVAAVAAGTLNATSVTTGSGSTINFNHTDNAYTFASLISGTGVLNQLSGTTILTGNNRYTGTTTISGGTLRINGDQSAATGLASVASGATLGGSGTIGGSVSVADGGILAPGNSPGTLTINGDLSLSGGSLLNYELGQANTVGGSLNDLTVVKGNLTLDGTINVTVPTGGTFGPGLYRVISYGGSLTDNGLSLGTMPSSDVTVQTSVAGQVNLINTGGQTLNFWDGTAAKFNNQIDGGSGTWQASTGNTNWANSTGAVNAGYSDGSLAIFSGTPGTVTIDNGLGAVTASGLQFASDGYTITGNPLTLTGTQSTIRVGDGTAAGAGYTATIASVIQGSSQLVKSDLGTLVLSGTNTYTGGTEIDAGTLSVTNSNNLGAAGTALTINGGTLLWTGGVAVLNHTVNWGANGGGIGVTTTGANGLTISNGLVGGALTKSGAGKLVLTGDNIFSGGMTIAAGSVQIGSAAAATITGNIVDNGTLAFNTSNDWTYAGSITGTGGTNSLVSGTLTFTGNSNYGGGTAIGGGGTFRYLAGTTTAGGATTLTASNMTVDAGAAYNSLSLLARSTTSGPTVVSVVNGGVLNITGTLTLQTAIGSTLAALNVSGAGSRANFSNNVTLGAGTTSNNSISITDGGKMATGALTTMGTTAGNATLPSITIDGTGSDWTSQGALTMNDGTLSLTNGGTATFSGITAGTAATVPATILVSGSGSKLSTTGDLTVGSGNGSATMTLADGGAASVGGSLVLGGTSTATGRLNIGAAFGAATTGAGTLSASGIAVNVGSAVNFNHTDTGYTLAALISGAGVVNQLAGTTILTGNNSYTGATTISGGTLRINGDQSAATGLTSVASGATLGGSGIVGGNVAVADGGILAPGNSPGTLTINGNLSLSGGSLLNYEIGQANVVAGSYNDLTIVKGNLTLDGTINVTVPTGGSFGPGLYRVISYNGSLTDNGLSLGTMPAGSDVSVQTSVANQVNLINTGGQTLSFWDGAAGPKFNNQVDGGNGIWQASAGNTNWANATGAVNAGYSDGAFAIFSAAPGTVTIDNSLGAVTASGLQFASDGYLLKGDALTLTAPQSTIRVGDGTLVGAGFTATIDAAIQGNAQLVKSDVGTLVLTGANSYTGGTAINGGTLRIASDGNLGAATGGLSFSGSTLSTSADLVTARGVSLVGDGAVAPDAATTLTLNGVISGSGGLFQNGGGTLVLTGTNSYTGATTVGAGTLLVNGNQSAATGLTSVANGATLGGTGTIGGDVTLTNGATLSPGIAAGTGSTAGTLTINGNLSLSSGSVLNYQLGQVGVAGGALNDLVNVGGRLVLDGTLNVSVTSGGTFDPGIYRLFNYGGTLTDNGLSLGAMPGGSAVTVQTSVAGQVNLVNTNGLLLSYWDGAGNGKNNDVINGGNGLWQASTGNDNWTTPSGDVNAPNATGSFAIFAGTAGTVSVDNSLGAVSASGMQFATSGYRINGAKLLLTGAQSIIRVGDGTAAGANYTATIDAVLGGSTQLVKTDAGTLILTGANEYTNGTSINGGTLQIASDANLGAATGGVTLNGGTLSTTADLTSARAFDVVDTSGITTAKATTLTLTGALTGPGALTKNGPGTLLLAGDGSSYTGAAMVAAGTLAVTGQLGGSLTVGSGASLAGTGQVSSVTNGGTVSPGLNGGFGTLTVAGAYTGANGTLAIKAALGGDASRSDLLVVNGSTAGNTTIKVTNTGGLGAATVNGIKVVAVTGASNGTFTLAGDYLFEGQQAVVAGAYGYRLYKNGVNSADGNWYLRSSLLDAGTSAGGTPVTPAQPLYQPGVPVYEAYSQTLLALNDLGTMQQRIGDRQWMQGGERQSGLWQRFEGQGLRANAAQSTSLARVGVDIWKVEVGADQVLSQRADGSALVLGVVAGYGEATSNVGSIYGNGSIKTSAYSLSGTLSWFGPQGFYVDGRAQVNWYDSRLTSSVLGSLVDGNKGRGEAYSLEIGKRWPVGGHLSVTPQMQMVYSTIGFDGFTDPHGAVVTSRLGDSVKSRWGISLDRQDGRSHLYAVASLSYEWLDGTVTDVSGAAIGRENFHLWGEASVGANVVLGRGFSIFAQASGKSATQDFGKSYGWKGNAGFRLAF